MIEPARRRFLQFAFFGINAAIAFLLSVPVLGYLLGPVFRRRGGQWVEAGPAEGLAGEVPRGVRIQYVDESGYSATRKTEVVWVSRGEGEGEVLALSSICSHLGCNVVWKGEESVFFCPCHGALFDRRGGKISGPQQGPLRRLNTRVEGGKLYVEV